MKTVLTLSGICLLFFSCKKNMPARAGFWACDIIQNDSAIIAGQLIGTWKWTHYQCPGSALTVAGKNIQVSFQDTVYTLKENSIEFSHGSWTLQPELTKTWVLKLSSPEPYLPGLIRFCDNRVVFANGYVDGCDNYFEKQQ